MQTWKLLVDINKAVVYKKKSAVVPPELGSAEDAAPKKVKSTYKIMNDRHGAWHKQTTLPTDKHNDEKLAITLLIKGAGMTRKESQSPS